MEIPIDPREVKNHLEYLGYTNITKEQLKDFIRDLKKLIKYEQSKENKAELKNKEKRGKLNSQNSQRDSPDLIESAQEHNNYEEDCIRLSENQCRRLTATYNSPSINYVSEVPVHDNSPSSRSYHANDYIDDNFTYKDCDNQSCCCCKKEEEKHFPSSKKKYEPEKPVPPPPSFIRPGRCKPSKCDPVALYHYYQSQWAKRPLPGEDPRSDLRWAIRTRLAQPPQQVLQQKVATEGKPRKEWIS